MKKFALASMIAIIASSPAVAVPTNTSATFPQNGYMLEDYTYTNAATATNMAGVYEDSVNADADYGDCPAGYWCDASGQHACSTAGDGSYTLSATGANENTACYKACTVANANIAHALTVTGNDYYGAGTDTCSAATCENGYHIQPSSMNLNPIIGTDTATIWGYVDAYGYGSAQQWFNFGSERNVFGVKYGGIKIQGHAQCASQKGTGLWGSPAAANASEITMSATLPDSTGRYCYCMVDSYTPGDGSPMSISGSWVFYGDTGSSNNCNSDCAEYCGVTLAEKPSESYLVFRSAVLGSRTGAPNTCEANTITINWSNASAADIAANEAGTVTYGGDIRTPRAAEIIPGKVFIGWTFSAPEQGG